MAKLRREQEKVKCEFCEKEVAKSGLANHQKNCPMNPANAEKDASELEEDIIDEDDVDTSEEDEEEEDSTVDNSEDESEDEEDSDTDDADEEPTPDHVVKASNPEHVVAIGLHDHKFFQYNGYVVIKRGEEVVLDKENFKVLAQQGHVMLK